MTFLDSVSIIFSSALLKYSSNYNAWRTSPLHKICDEDFDMRFGTMFDCEQTIKRIYERYIFFLNDHPLSPCEIKIPSVWVESKEETFLTVYGGSCPHVDVAKDDGFIVPCPTVRISNSRRMFLNSAFHELDHSISYQLAQRFRDNEIDPDHVLYEDCKKLHWAYTHSHKINKRGLIGNAHYLTGIVERRARSFGFLGSELLLT